MLVFVVNRMAVVTGDFHSPSSLTIASGAIMATVIAAVLKPCYGFRLRTVPDSNDGLGQKGLILLHNIIVRKCHELYWAIGLIGLILACPGFGQQPKTRPAPPGSPDQGFVRISATTQDVEGSVRHLRGTVRIETNESLLTADEVDFDDDTKIATARGHVHFEQYSSGDVIDCDHAEYNADDETGKFYIVHGTSPAKVQSRPGILTTSNPFYFEGKWAERIEDKYIVHDGYITDCKIPKPWWRLTGPKFDIVPNDRALAYRTIFRIRGMPIF